MRKNLVNQQQPFGHVRETPMYPNNVPIQAGRRNSPGSTQIVGNNGHNHAIPGTAFHDDMASRFHDNPFHFTGKPRK